MKTVHITYLGHACFLLECAGYRTVIDPYADGKVPGLKNLRLEAEAVYCSHDHADHNATECVRLLPGNSAPYTVTQWVTPHDDAGGKLRGMNTVRIFDFDGLRIAHLGDIGCPLEPAWLEKLKGVDCLLIPVGGFYTIDPAQAKAIAEQVRPRVIIPMHYRTDTSGYAQIAPLEDFTALFTHANTADHLALTADTPAQLLVLHQKYKE